jgi:N-hydroxyarylamine O-acetyltransferase
VGAFDVDRYLARIGYGGPRHPSPETLIALQLAHLTSVPFENLHVFHRVGVRVDVGWSYPKIVEEGRGGWCFELNGCFAELLRRLGYRVEQLSCRTFEPATGGLSDEFDHLALLVHVDGTAYLADVGWGDGPLRPLPAEPGEYPSRPRRARIETDASTVRLIEVVERADGTAAWELQYEASRRPRLLEEFDPRSRYLQTAPGLNWTEKPLVTRATSGEGGRVTLHRDRLRVRGDDLAIEDRPVAAEQWTDELRRWFDLTVPTAELHNS